MQTPPDDFYTGSMQIVQYTTTEQGKLEIKAIITNDSNYHWNSNNDPNVRICYHWYKKNSNEIEVLQWDGSRIELPVQGIPSHQSLQINVVLDTPVYTNQYLLMLTLIAEDISWFEEKTFKPASCEIDVYFIPRCLSTVYYLS